MQQYLNVTRAELFFARRIVFVEGAAELFLVEALAKTGYDLRKHSISIISTDGLNFGTFLPLFGEKACRFLLQWSPMLTRPRQTSSLQPRTR